MIYTVWCTNSKYYIYSSKIGSSYCIHDIILMNMYFSYVIIYVI